MGEGAELELDPLPGRRLSYTEPVVEERLEERLDDAVDRGVRYLLSIQHREGFWLGRSTNRVPPRATFSN